MDLPNMNLYRFSPISDQKTFQKALDYIVLELDKLANELLRQSLPINTVKIFAHYPHEYDYLYKFVAGLGPEASFSSKKSFYIEKDMKISGHMIKYIGVRIIDPYRMQVGCGDYEVSNYNELREKHLNESQFVRDFNGEMVELWHPDYDVLGYIVPPLEDNNAS